MKKKKESNNRYEKHRPRNTYIHTKRILKKNTHKIKSHNKIIKRRSVRLKRKLNQSFMRQKISKISL